MVLVWCNIQTADERTSTVTFPDAPDSVCRIVGTSGGGGGLSAAAAGPSGHTDGPTDISAEEDGHPEEGPHGRPCCHACQ